MQPPEPSHGTSYTDEVIMASLAALPRNGTIRVLRWPSRNLPAITGRLSFMTSRAGVLLAVQNATLGRTLT